MIRDFPGAPPGDTVRGVLQIMASKGTCKADSCDKDVRAKGYCDRHYRKWRKGVMGKPRHTSCNQKDCGKAPHRRGLCEAHYEKEFAKKPAAAPGEATAEATAE